MEDRLERLEALVAMQDRTIEELDGVVADQQRQIDELERKLMLLGEKVKRNTDSQDDQEPGPEPPPPHYGPGR